MLCTSTVKFKLFHNLTHRYYTGTMRNCLPPCFPGSSDDQDVQDLPISSVFRFPNPIPSCPTGWYLKHCICLFVCM